MNLNSNDTEPPRASASESDPDADLSGRTLGDFRLDRKLGQGAAGTVYQALQLSMDRVVAVKVLSRALASNSEYVDRFRREAQMSAKLDSPHVVRGLSVGKEGDLHFLAMEFVDGDNLLETLGRLGRLPVGSSVRIVLQVARALAEAEQRGMVHRDIKPANIMIGRDGTVKLADLGLAKTQDNDLSVTGLFLGTPAYMAPEQVEHARAVDQRSDIYSLGATFYHLITGRRPPRGSSDELVAARNDGRWSKPSTINPAIPSVLDRIIAKMLDPVVSTRYQHASELIADLEATGLAARGAGALDGDPDAITQVPALPATAATPRPASRRPPWTLALVTLVLLGVGAALYFQARPKPESGGAPARLPLIGADARSERTMVISTAVARILARAYGELATGRLDDARAQLRRGLERYPRTGALERPLQELERGALALFQYQTGDETFPLASVWDHGDLVLTARDNYRFAFVTTRPCFLYAFNIDERPSVSVLFPNRQYSPLTNPVSASIVHWVPANPNDPRGSWLHLDDFVGTERIVFIGLTRPLRDPDAVAEQLRTDPDATLRTVEESPHIFVAPDAPAPTSCFANGRIQEFRFQHR